MITAELNHNPYLLLTTVRFNGQPPRINSQVEKYESVMLKDWIHKVPGIYHDEMNGYDFDLYFTGTKSDYESLRKAFTDKGISEDDVRLFHKNELEGSETKSGAIDDLLQWLRENRNRKFHFEAFYEKNQEHFESAYPYVIINGTTDVQIHPQVSAECVRNAAELEDTVLTNTPVLFYLEPNSTKLSREDLKQLLKRPDIRQNQLFFLLHPQLNAEQVRRVILDLGVEDPQIVTAFDAEAILAYIRDYPITEFVRDSIHLFREAIAPIEERLEEENRESERQNAEIHAQIDAYENQLTLLKEADLFFTHSPKSSRSCSVKSVIGEIVRPRLSVMQNAWQQQEPTKRMWTSGYLPLKLRQEIHTKLWQKVSGRSSGMLMKSRAWRWTMSRPKLSFNR